MDEIVLDVQQPGIMPVAKMIGRRIVARLIDIMVLGMVGWVALWSLPIERMGDHGWLIGFVIVVLYDSFSHSKWGGGATVGKWILGLRVVDEFGAGLPWRRSLLRSLPFALPLVARSIGLEFQTFLPSVSGAAAYQAMVSLLIGWVAGAPLLMAVTTPSRSYCDLFGKTVCLSRRMLALFGLPRLGIQLFARTVNDEKARSIPNLFTARTALVHFLWAVPLLTFAVVGSFYQPVQFESKSLQRQLRQVVAEQKLPVRGVVVEHGESGTDTILVQARLAVGFSGNFFAPKDISTVSLALWTSAIKLVPKTVPLDHVIVELRSGPDLGFTSRIETNAKSYQLQLNPQEQTTTDSTASKNDSTAYPEKKSDKK